MNLTNDRLVGIIGQGFVGGSLTTVLTECGATVYAYDKAGKYAPEARSATDQMPANIAELVKALEQHDAFTGIVFVCVPTPMAADGSADISIVDAVLHELANAKTGELTVVLKSTVPPGSVARWNAKLNPHGLYVVFNPEFLTEANALNDMRNQTRIVLGGPNKQVTQVAKLYASLFPLTPILLAPNSTTAEMVKYMTNIHLAVRVILSCELQQICQGLQQAGYDVDYQQAVNISMADARLGNSHMQVPGANGIAGARGHCFPKDMNAMIALAKQIGIEPTVLEAAWQANLKIVPPEYRDWEQMIGRAVSDRGNYA
jgi:UDPglucose 6-dehydrogenase